jgi:acetylornithine deacetylase/succinyl-diaminopimelate desuccinylase-like protein
VRTWAEPSVDVHGIAGGSPVLVKTVIPVEAQANVSIRLVGGQDHEAIAATMERLLREAAPDGADVEVTLRSTSPAGLIPADAKAVQLGLDAFEHVLGARPLLNRSGGAIPLVSALARQGVPTILTGFALNESNVHSPNERLVADYLALGVETSCELFRRLGELG